MFMTQSTDTTERVPGHPDPGDEINRRKQDDRSTSYGYQWPFAEEPANRYV